MDPSTFLGRQKHDKKQWSEQYHQKQIALQGKFTFPAAVPLENPEGLAPGDISLINAIDVRFSYKPETNVFIFNDPISFNVTAATRCGVMGPNGAGKSHTILPVHVALARSDCFLCLCSAIRPC